MFENPEPFSKDEIAHHRAAAANGIIPSLETVRRYIATIRKSWASKPEAQRTGKSRNSKPKPDESQIDFF